MNGINNLKISSAAIRKGCIRDETYQIKKFINDTSYIKSSIFTYTKDGNEPIDWWNLKTCNTCKISRSKKGNVEQNHLHDTIVRLHVK